MGIERICQFHFDKYTGDGLTETIWSLITSCCLKSDLICMEESTRHWIVI